MGDRGPTCRSTAANVYRSGGTDCQHSTGTEPVHAGHADRVHDDSVGSVALSGHSDPRSEAIADAQTACRERKHVGNTGHGTAENYTNAGQDSGAGKDTAGESARVDDRRNSFGRA